jgi:hypothetical protein
MPAGEVGDGFEHFQSLDCFVKTPFMLGCGRTNLVLNLLTKRYILGHNGNNPSVQQSHSQIAPGKTSGCRLFRVRVCYDGHLSIGTQIYKCILSRCAEGIRCV